MVLFVTWAKRTVQYREAFLKFAQLENNVKINIFFLLVFTILKSDSKSTLKKHSENVWVVFESGDLIRSISRYSLEPKSFAAFELLAGEIKTYHPSGLGFVQLNSTEGFCAISLQTRIRFKITLFENRTEKTNKWTCHQWIPETDT